MTTPSLFTLSCDLWVPAPIDEVWTFGSDPANLEKITPPRYGATVHAQGPLAEETRVIIDMKPWGIPLPLHWVSILQEIQAEGPRRQFVDVQASGPFASWRHTHIFESGEAAVQGVKSESAIKSTKPGTWIRDRVEYALPGGVLGLLAHKLYLRRDLENMFFYRREKLREHFAARG